MWRHLTWIAFGCLLTLLGLVGGFVAARQGGAGGGHGEEAGGHEGHGEEAAGGGAPALDARTLANLGVRIAPARRTTFTRVRQVQAVVEDRPENAQPVFALLGGIVTAVRVEAGGAAGADDVLVVLARDPIARPKPELTADVLTPISEEVHAGVAALRSALGRLAIVEVNLARLRKAATPGADGTVSVFRRSEIEYQNERARIAIEKEAARHELERHGLTAKEIAGVEAGAPAPRNQHLWEHALRQGGLWPDTANTLRASLPEADRALPWCVVAIGELSAAGLATEPLARALSEEPALAKHFAEAAGLLLQGMPLGTVRLLARRGALEPEVHVRAPAGVDRWDVEAVGVRVGQQVAAGEVLLRLHDARRMRLRLQPVGEEIGHVVSALARGVALEAKPLVDGSGPVLAGVRLRRLDTHAEEATRGGGAYAEVQNALLCPPGDTASCSWNLRVGLRYMVSIPVASFPGRFVLPFGAVTERGADRIVLVQDGDGFRPQTVRVEYEDDEVVVVADDGGIFDDDPVVTSGAFALSLALQLESGPVDPHAGHNH